MGNINRTIKTTIFILGLTIFGLAPAAQALADPKHNKQRNHHGYNNYDKKHGWRHNYRNNHRRDHSWRYKNRYNNPHRGNELVFGMLAGGLLFHAMTNNQRGSNYGRTVYVQQQPVLVQPKQQQWTHKQPVQQQNVAHNNNACQQVREYQTTITVGGQSVPAYGQSCLQPDGSWKLGPAIPEPGY
ncbi:hypothetical protein MNBD_ALPHA03-925 [hydrothermal vent metagenome]|uniref:Surface antigen domain-containing protein n=1 Tax=hydrothermal vent metagenome TaxID=652676 RepID=A0A3B1B2W9_9ZZZZ